MNYRHAFHAGNFADVHKHVVLFALLQHLHKKPAPFFVLDTHAGRGTYDLNSEEAQRSGEWRDGIERLRNANTLSPLLESYLRTVSTDHSYFGSPLLIASMLRATDRAVFVEQQPEEARILEKALAKHRRAIVQTADGYAMLKAHLPPKENRGLVLIDPPYENESEFADASIALRTAQDRWSNGIYCIWYPIKLARHERRFHQSLAQSGIKKILALELNVRPIDSPLGLNGSGVVVINPPWQLDEQMRTTLLELKNLLAKEAGSFCVEWLVGE